MIKRIKNPMSIEKKQSRMGYVFILPLIIGAVFLFIPDMVKTFVFSINDTVIENGSYSLDWKGFFYYNKSLFVNADFIPLVVNTIGQMIVQVPTIVIFSLFIASVLNQKFHGRALARAIFFLPVVLATGIVTKVEASFDIAAIMPNRQTLDASVSGGGLFDFSALLASLHFNSAIIDFVVSAANGVYDIVSNSGMQIFIFLACYQEIPTALYEAAEVEGCSKWEIFWKITFPMVRRQIIVTAVYTIIDTFTKSDSKLYNYIHDIAFAQNQYSYATSMYIIYLVSLGSLLAASMFIGSRLIRRNG